MAHNVLIAAAAAVTAAGDTLDDAWDLLMANRSAVREVTRFDATRLICRRAAEIADLAPDPEGGRFLSLLRRLTPRLPPLPRDTFVILATTKSAAETVQDMVEKGRDPEAFGYRQWLGGELGLSDAGLEINSACASSAIAVALGAAMVQSGERDAALIVGADIVSRFVFTGFAALKGLSPTVCRPFDARRDGLVLGEAAAAILLASPETAKRQGWPALARVAGWGVANDANHVTGPARDARGLLQAARLALDMAGLAPDAVGAFRAHGTGTVYNDAMELTAIDTLFGPRRFPVFSIKGALGHCLGAAGALELALSVRCLLEKVVPPTVGMETPEPRAEGRVSTRPQPFDGDAILNANSGFSGVNAAIILKTGGPS